MCSSFKFILCIVMFVSHDAGYSKPLKIFFKIDTFIYSEPTSISGALSDNKESYVSGGEHQIASVWFETGLKLGSWGASTLYREEHRYKFSPDTADFHNSTSATHQIDAGRKYQLDLGVERFKAKGLRLSYLINDSNRYSLKFGLSYFRTYHLLSGNLTGTAQANSTSDYDYDVDVDYNYNEELLFGRGAVDKPEGTGMSVDLTGNWKVNNQVEVKLKIKDLYGKIKWKNAPETVANATSNIKVIGPDGFVIIQPSITGVHSSRAVYTQTISPTVSLDLEYKLSNSSNKLIFKNRHFSGKTFSAIGGEYSLKKGGSLSAAIWPSIGVLEVGYNKNKLSVNLGTDNLDLSKSRAIWLSFGVND